MPSCSQCGTANAPSYRNCIGCGSLLQDSMPAAPTFGAPPGAPVAPQAYNPTAGASARRPSSPSITPGLRSPVDVPTVASAQPHAPTAKLVGFLISYDTDPVGAYHPLYAGERKIGRKDAAPDLAVPIDHPTVSSLHAVLHLKPEQHMAQIEDLQSANGTLLNNVPIAGQGRREIRDGDRLRLGAFNAVLKLVDAI